MLLRELSLKGRESSAREFHRANGHKMPQCALVVIDMLNDLFQREPRLAQHRDRLVASINDLASGFRRLRSPVIWVRQEFASDLSDAFLKVKRDGIRVTIAGSTGSQLLPELQLDEGDEVIVKKRYSAYFGTELDDLLHRFQTGTLVIAGINTHACVRMTAIDAYQRDLEVFVASECIASYDEEHHEVTRRYLEKGIARFLTNSEIVKSLELE